MTLLSHRSLLYQIVNNQCERMFAWFHCFVMFFVNTMRREPVPLLENSLRTSWHGRPVFLEPNQMMRTTRNLKRCWNKPRGHRWGMRSAWRTPHCRVASTPQCRWCVSEILKAALRFERQNRSKIFFFFFASSDKSLYESHVLDRTKKYLAMAVNSGTPCPHLAPLENEVLCRTFHNTLCVFLLSFFFFPLPRIWRC